MHPRLRRTVIALVGALALPTVAVVPAAAAGPGTISALAIEGHVTAVFAPPARFEVTVDTDTEDVEVLTVTAGDGAGGGFLVLRTAADAPSLAVGHYEFDSRASKFRVGTTKLGVGAGNRGCSAATGSLDVVALTRDEAGRLTSIAAEYRTTKCDYNSFTVVGSLRWNSDLGFRHTTSTGFSTETIAGQPARGTVTLQNAGSLPQTYGVTEILPYETGPAALVERDGCARVTVPPGGTCRVDVRIASDGVHHFTGYSRTPDESLDGIATAGVSMWTWPIPEAPVVTAVARRGAIELSVGPWFEAFRILRSVDGGPETTFAHVDVLPWTDTSVREGSRYTYRVAVSRLGVEGPPSTPVTSSPLHVPTGAEGQFVAIDPVRVLDTREGLGARLGPVGPGEIITFDPALGGHVPATGVSAVLLNLTGTQPTSATHVRAWPAGDPLPPTSSLNLRANQSRPNQVVVPVGADGRVALYNDAGFTHLVVDIQGFYSAAGGPAGGGFHPFSTSHRYLDTRQNTWHTPAAPLGPGEEVVIQLNIGSREHDEATAADVNLTVTQPTHAGHLVAWPGDTAAPNVSNVNFAPGQTVPNHAVVPVSLDEFGHPCIVVRNNSPGSVHLVVDVQGWYDDGMHADALRFAPARTDRVADTRERGRQMYDDESLVIPGSDLPAAVAHVVNLTATDSPGDGYLIAWGGVGERPSTSAGNYSRGEDAPNLATLRAAPNGQVTVTSRGAGVHVVVDHLGVFY